MTLNKTMENAIRAKDYGSIYSSFYTILLSDPGFATDKFDATLEEVKKRNLDELFKKYNGTPFKMPEDWNQEYWDSVASELVDNFCPERINHLKDISNKLYSSTNMYKQDTEWNSTSTIDSHKKKRKVSINRVISKGGLLEEEKLFCFLQA